MSYNRLVDCLIFRDINNGVYRCGFATTQEAYDTAVVKLFEGLDKVRIIMRFTQHKKLKDCKFHEYV